MATPTFLRYLPARLKPLSSPAVWAPLTVFTLLSLFIWEYHKNPDWFNRPQISNVDPNSNLTPEEQARLSEIDTLDLLLRNARVPNSDDLSTSLINLGTPEALSGETAETIAPDRSLAGRDNPFAAYEEEYRFPGSSRSTTSPAVSPAASTNSASNLSTTVPASGSNALSEALNRQQATRGEGGDRTPLSINSPRTPAIGAQSNRPFAEASSGSVEGSLESAGSLSGRGANAGNNGGSIAFPTQVPSSGVSTPFIRTTQDMSPPVGTTGYQVPTSTSLPVFNVPPQQPTRNPFSQPASLPAVPAPAAASATPTVNYTAPSFTQPEQNSRR